MKNIKYSVLLLLLLGVMACDDEFLEVVPDTAIEFEDFINSADDVEATLNSSYKALADGSFMAGQRWLLSELMVDHINGDLISNGEWESHFTRTTDIFLGTTRSLMASSGRVIGRANYTLDNIEAFVPDAAQAQRIEGEAKFFRAFAHFEQVRMFAQPYGFTEDNSHPGISIWREYTPDPQPRASVAAVYDFVLQDLQEALDLLPEENGVKADKNAVRALLARVYFQMNRFQDALTFATPFVGADNNGFPLDSLNNRFSFAPTSEAIFEIVGDTSELGTYDVAGALNSYYRNGVEGAQVYASQELFDVVSSNPMDARAAWLASAGGLVLVTKFPQDEFFNIPLLHTTEMYLIYAESIVQVGDDASGRAAINVLRDRAMLDPLPGGLTGINLIEAIRRDRRIELMFEGDRFHELKRQAVLDTPDLTIRGAIWSCPGMVNQFPDNELNGNQDFAPNPQGGCN